ncbi:hypothetical protein ACP70R_006389 [Stipagrostis hirtigluma subsp. patula]
MGRRPRQGRKQATAAARLPLGVERDETRGGEAGEKEETFTEDPLPRKPLESATFRPSRLFPSFHLPDPAATQILAHTEEVRVVLMGQTNLVHGKIHILLHAGRAVCESLAILQYLDEASGTGTIVPPPLQRCACRSMALPVSGASIPGYWTAP